MLRLPPGPSPCPAARIAHNRRWLPDLPHSQCLPERLPLDTLIANHAPDASSAASYTAATGSVLVSVLQAIGTGVAQVTVTPSATNITDEMAITVSVPVKGATGQPTPSGTITLTSGGLQCRAELWPSGTASFSIPAGSWLRVRIR